MVWSGTQRIETQRSGTLRPVPTRRRRQRRLGESHASQGPPFPPHRTGLKGRLSAQPYQQRARAPRSTRSARTWRCPATSSSGPGSAQHRPGRAAPSEGRASAGVSFYGHGPRLGPGVSTKRVSRAPEAWAGLSGIRRPQRERAYHQVFVASTHTLRESILLRPPIAAKGAFRVAQRGLLVTGSGYSGGGTRPKGWRPPMTQSASTACRPA
jgi:hypothetical protein